MLTDLTSAVANISSEELDKFFEEPAANPAGGQDPNKDNPKIKTQSTMDVEVVETLEDFLKSTSGQAGTSGQADTSGQAGTSAFSDTSGTSGTSAQADTSGTSGSAGTTAAAVADEQTVEALTNTVKFLIEKGIFKDFEGREDMKFTPELYQELLEAQVGAMVDERYTSKKQATGEYGEAIIDFVEKGGDADKIIDLFKEQKAIQEFDITDDESKKELVVKWYKENHGWKADKIAKYVSTLLAEEGALEAEANDIKGKYDAFYKQQLKSLSDQQAFFEQEQAKKQKAFETSISDTLTKTKDLDDVRRRLIKDALFKQKKLEDGTTVNDLFIKLAQIQADPNEYIEFAEFVVDKKGYLKRKELEFQNKAVDKRFQFVKGNAAVDKNKGSNFQEKEKEDKYTGTNFRFALK